MRLTLNVMNCIVLDLTISPEEYLKLYEGIAQNVRARARDGRRIQFPASSLRPFVTSQGIHGRFQLVVDENNKLIDIKKLT